MKFIVFLFIIKTIICFSLHQIFRNNMVIQRDQPASIYGFSQEQRVRVTFNGQNFEANVQNGRFNVPFGQYQASGPHQIQVTSLPSGSSITLSNVLVSH
jgi:hypothetical protein